MRSGVHLTGEDSGWPVGGSAEPNPKKDGTGADPWPHAEAVVDDEVISAGEIQEVELDGGDTGTHFTLTFAGQTTASIAKTATAAAVKSALEALSNIAVGDVVVQGPAGGPWTISFTEDGAYAGDDVGAMTGDGVGVDEVQTVTITGTPTGGTFKLTYLGQQTGTINHNAAAATVLTALRALSTWPDSEGGVTGSAGGPYTVTFSGNTLGEGDRAALTADGALLTGGTAPAVNVTTGTPGKVGPTVVVATLADGED